MLRINLYKSMGVALLAFSLLTVGCGGGEERQAVYLERAQEYFDEGNIEKAKIEVKNVRQINPNNKEAIFLSGLIAEEEENYREAFQSFSAVVQLSPDDVKALNKLSFYYVASKQIDEATANLEKVLASEPDNATALALMALMLVQQEDTQEQGAEYARKALAQDPANVTAITVLASYLTQGQEDPEAGLVVLNEGIAQQPTDNSLKELKIRILALMKRYDEIPAVYRELIDQNPEALIYIYRLAAFYATNDEQGKEAGVAKAEGMLRAEIEKNPDEDQLKIWLVKLLSETDSIDVGIETLEQFVASSPDSEMLRDNLATGYLANEDMGRAEGLYLDVIEKDPESVAAINARNNLVSIALRQGEQEKAEELIAEVLEIDAENTDVLIARARLYLADGDYASVIPDMRVVLKNEPDSAGALLLLASANEKMGSLDLALDGYQTLLVHQPKNFIGLVSSGRILLQKQEYEAAQKILEAAQEINPVNLESSRLLVTVYAQQGQWDSALSVAAKLIENEDTIAVGYYLQGRIYLLQKNYKAGINAMEKSLAADDRIVESLSGLVSGYLATDQRDVAIKYLLKHIEKNPDRVKAKELLAGVYAGEKEYEKSADILTKLIAENPEGVSAYRLLMRVYAAQGNTSAIAALLQEGIDNSPDTLEFYALQAELFQRTGEIDKSIASYETLLSKSPDNLMAKNNLAALLLDYRLTGPNLQRAAELANDLGATEVPAYLDTAGWVQYQLENYPQALALIQLAVDNGGNTAVYQYHLGMAYYKNNMPDPAKEALTLAVSVEGEYPGKDEAQKVLDTL